MFFSVNFISTAEVAEIIPGCYSYIENIGEYDAEIIQVNKTILVRKSLIKIAKNNES